MPELRAPASSSQVDDYQLVNVSSEKAGFPANNLLEGLKKGWLAEGREASLLIEFASPIHLNSVSVRITDACPVAISLYAEGQASERESFVGGAPMRDHGSLSTCVLVHIAIRTDSACILHALKRTLE